MPGMADSGVIPPTLGQAIPPDTPHAVSVSLPTWKCNVGYEEGDDWVVSRMSTGYPRFFIHKSIQNLAGIISRKYAASDEGCLLLHSHGAASRCVDFLRGLPSNEGSNFQILVLSPATSGIGSNGSGKPLVFAVIHPLACEKAAKDFWQHTGEGISSRRAEFCTRLLEQNMLEEDLNLSQAQKSPKGPRRYKKDATFATNLPQELSGAVPALITSSENGDSARFLEERFGRNLDINMAENAKLAVRRRIAGSLVDDVEIDEALRVPEEHSQLRNVVNMKADDVYLYPGGMNSIYNTHRMTISARGMDVRKSICFGFPYIDTLKVLEKFGPGVLFYGNGSQEDLDDLERRLSLGERYNALFCEFPSNPLLRSPDLERIHQLSRQFDFIVVVDETVGNFLNIHVLPYADVVVSSLTKIFSGDSNVMGGSAILNPEGQYYHLLKNTWNDYYQDLIWPEDAIFLERNSRDFVQRIVRINANAEAACDVLQRHPKIKNVFYPSVNPTRKYYDARRTPNGGYGGLMSATFHTTAEAAAFYDNLHVEKGPSLGTNFTLASPFVILAHYSELDWAESYGVDRNLVRFSIGLEETSELVDKLKIALSMIP